MNENDYLTLEAMRMYGGGFVRQLAELYSRADMVNQAKIKATWPEYWEQYKGMADINRQREASK